MIRVLIIAMVHKIQNFARGMLAAAIAAVGMIISAWAVEPTIYRDCFRVVPGQIPHLVCTVEGLEGIDYAVDKHASNDWVVVIHGWGMDDPRIKKAPQGEHLLNDNNFTNGIHEVPDGLRLLH